MKLKHIKVSDQPTVLPPAQQFPSARYFQVHFEHIQQTVRELGEKLELVQRQLAELSAQRDKSSG